MKGRDFLAVNDFSREELEKTLELATELKAKQKAGEPHELLEGKSLAMVFQKPSTRTRISFEVGMTQLGGHALYLGYNDLQLGRKESIADTARTISRYADGIMARLFKHEDAVELAKYADVPVINGLTDREHPCQTVTDVLTMKEKKGRLEGLEVAFLGDAENNVCHSLLAAGALLGINFRVACPKNYSPLQEFASFYEKTGRKLLVTQDPAEAVKDADVVYTDTWVSMGDEAEKEKRVNDLKPFQVSGELMKEAKPDAIFMHDLPAYRGLEVTAEVIDGPQSVVFDQAENRLHAQKAIMALLMGGIQ